MSVKRKFRKSKKTKGKTKDNNKHKNNEKRNKIQRKTKKRVLRGGLNTALVYENTNGGLRLRGMTGKFSILKPSDNECKEWFTNIADVYSRDKPPPIKPDTKAEKDFKYCISKVGNYTNFSPPSTPQPEQQELIIEKAPVVQEINEETDEERKQRLAAEAQAAEEQRLAEKASRKKEAEEQVQIDSQVQTDEMPDSKQTLDLSNQHEALTTKYIELEANEQDPEIKEIYNQAKIHHNLASTRLQVISMEQQGTENANTTQDEGALPPASNISAPDVSETTTRPNVEKSDAELDAIKSEKLQEVTENVRLGNVETKQTRSNLEAKKKALELTRTDMKTPIEEIENNPGETLRLAETHGALAKKYEKLANEENDEEIKEIYMNSKDYHEHFYNTLQEAAEIQELKKKEEQAAQAPIEPKIVDELELFPSACFGKYSICKKKLNELENQSFFCYKFLKHMKEFFIKKSTLIDFDSNLSSDNVPRFSASPNFIDQYLNFFEFYNEHIAGGDDTKKIVVKTQGGRVIVSQDDENKEKYIVIEQYPNIDLKTFFDNCNKLYDLSLPQVCNFRLAELAYNEEKFVEEFNTSLTIQEMIEKLDNFTPTIFIPTSIEEPNLQKIIKLLTLYHNRYRELLSKPEYETILSYLKQYNSILPPSPYFSESILPVIKDTSGHSLLDFIEFIVKYQLLYPRYSVICVKSLLGVSIDTTRAYIREGVQPILEPYEQQIREIVDSGDIFKSTCQFIAENPNIKTEIIKLIKNNNTNITNPGFSDFPSDSEKKCAAKSESFVIELENPSSDFKTNIFFHMIIFACYNTMVVKGSQWGIKGTTLMILFMNIFIINFFNNILHQVNEFCLKFFEQANYNQVSVILIDKSVSTLLEYIEVLEPFLLDLKIKKKTKQAFHLEEERTIELYAKFKKIQGMIKQKNNEQVKFIEGLSESYSQESTESVKSKKKTKFEEMNQRNLIAQMIERCKELKTKVETKYDQTYPGERKKWQSQQPPLEVTPDISVDFDPTTLEKKELEKVKDECKEFVVTLISVARAIKAKKYFDEEGNNISDKLILYGPDQLQQLNRCCDPRDVFNKGENSREHNKRIARAFYGLSEIWPYIQDTQKQAILQLPGVAALIQKFNADENFRNLVKWQCNDDGKAEKKFGVRWWGMSANRKGIMDNITPQELENTCSADVTFSNEKKDLIQPEFQQVVESSQVEPETPEEIAARKQVEAARQRAEEEFARDLAEAAANIALENPKLDENQKKEIRKNNKLKLAMAYVKVLNSPDDYIQSPGIIERAKNFENENPMLFLKAKGLVFFNQPAPKHKSEDIVLQDIINKKNESNSATNTSIISKFVGLFKKPKESQRLSVAAGGSVSTKNKTKHKSGHKAKAKTQSKSKSKHRAKAKTKSKTIKKNKRAHHKFDKKYTRKR